MNEFEIHEDALRAGIVTGFFLLGANLAAGALAGNGVTLLLLTLQGPVVSALVGLHAYRAALRGGAR